MNTYALNERSSQQGAALMVTTFFMMSLCIILVLNSQKNAIISMKIANAYKVDMNGRNDAEEVLNEAEKLLDGIETTEDYLSLAINNDLANSTLKVNWDTCGFPSKDIPNALISNRFMAREVAEGGSLNDIPAKNDVSYTSAFFMVDVLKTHKDMAQGEVILGEEGVSYMFCSQPNSNQPSEATGNGHYGSWEMRIIHSLDMNRPPA